MLFLISTGMLIFAFIEVCKYVGLRCAQIEKEKDLAVLRSQQKSLVIWILKDGQRDGFRIQNDLLHQGHFMGEIEFYKFMAGLEAEGAIKGETSNTLRYYSLAK